MLQFDHLFPEQSRRSPRMDPTRFIYKLVSHRLKQLFLVLLIWSGTVLALDPQRELYQFGHEVWLTENGLPQNTVHAITQTKDGYVWMATEGGLARFDGISFTISINRILRRSTATTFAHCWKIGGALSGSVLPKA